MKTQIAQKWLDKKYPKEKRINIKELNISDKGLKGSLKLENFNNLGKLDCSNNLITKLDLTSCKSEKLIKLDVSNNDFENQDLSCFSRFVNLKKLYLGTTKLKNINKGIYNRFTGSLELLKDLVELEKLAISNTNIDSGLEHLSEGLERVYCVNYLGENIGCEKVRKKLELNNCFVKNKQYYDLQVWRRVQKSTTTYLISRSTNSEVSFPFISNSSPMVNTIKAQKWLEQNHPKKERGGYINLDISSSKLGLGKILGGSLNLKDFKDLRLLSCSGHKITKLELSNYQQLEELYCDKNQLTSLCINDCPLLIKIDCSNNQLKNLTINDCPQLAELYCSNNCLTNFDFDKLNEEKLIRLDLNNNTLSLRDLSELTPFVNLELVNIGGSSDQNSIGKGFYNHFRGSLKPLKNMSKLKILNIEATDINDDDLECLPESLEEFYCTSYGTLTKVDRIEEDLKKYSDPLQEQTLPVPQSSSKAVALVGIEKMGLLDPTFGPNYIGNLRGWKKARMVESDEFNGNKGSVFSEFDYEESHDEIINQQEIPPKK